MSIVLTEEDVQKLVLMRDQLNEFLEVINEKRLKKFGKTIVIDPGHGLYKYNGAYIYQRPEIEGIREDLITMKIAEFLKQQLQERGMDCVCTRSFDTDAIGESGEFRWKECSYEYLKNEKITPNKFITWGEDDGDDYPEDINSRIQYINYLHRQVKSVDLVVSIHFNAGGGEGAECFYWHSNNRTKKIADNILNTTVQITGAQNRGIKPSGIYPNKIYGILKRTVVPSILWEGCFYDSKNDREKFLKDPNYYPKAASAIVEGIIQSIEQKLI